MWQKSEENKPLLWQKSHQIQPCSYFPQGCFCASEHNFHETSPLSFFRLAAPVMLTLTSLSSVHSILAAIHPNTCCSFCRPGWAAESLKIAFLFFFFQTAPAMAFRAYKALNAAIGHVTSSSAVPHDSTIILADSRNADFKGKDVNVRHVKARRVNIRRVSGTSPRSPPSPILALLGKTDFTQWKLDFD